MIQVLQLISRYKLPTIFNAWNYSYYNLFSSSFYQTNLYFCLFQDSSSKLFSCPTGKLLLYICLKKHNCNSFYFDG